MKKKILMLTNIYDTPDLNLLNSTSVCHYFAREWIAQGCDVRVVFNYHVYARFFHFLSTFFEKQIASLFATFITSPRLKKDSYYTIDDVKVARFPIYKFLPKRKYSYNSICKQSEKIKLYLRNEKFVPDYIVGHFHSPSLEIILELKKEYPGVRTCVVLHGKASNLLSFHGKKAYEMIQSIDLWGYRSLNIKYGFEKLYGMPKHSFLCMSGIPETFLATEIDMNFRRKIFHFVYVGSLIKRKYPTSIIPALIKNFPKKDFRLTIIGSGSEKSKILSQIRKFGLQNEVKLHGYLPRHEIPETLSQADCFIMISKNESFGLVYLEAMARGCITIASLNEGMDGIIKNEENGFLCEAGNYRALASTVANIRRLSPIDIEKISKKAYETAKQFTDKIVAEKYLEVLSSV